MENTDVVLRFNRDVIERGDEQAFRELMDPAFVNRTPMPGGSTGADGMWSTFHDVLRPAFPDLRVEIETQVTEGDLVVTRKKLHGTHRGTLFGIEPTGRGITVQVVDFVRVRDGRYVEHWGMNDFATVVAGLITT